MNTMKLKGRSVIAKRAALMKSS